VLEELLHHGVRRSVALDLDDDPHPGPVAFVANVAHIRDPLAADELGHLLDERGLVDLVGQLGDDDGDPPAGVLLERHLATDDDATPAGGVHVADDVDPLLLPGEAVALVLDPEDGAAGREVRPVHDLAQVVDRHVRVVDQRDHRRVDLGGVVGLDVGRHPHGDPGAPVDEEVRQSRGQDGRLAEPAVVVVDEVDGLLLNVGEHLVADRGQAGLGIAVGGRRVAVDRAEVPLAIYQRVAKAEVLRHAHEGVIQRHVAVGVVFGERVTDDPGALAVRRGGAQPHLVHRVQDSPMNGLEAVADVGQRARHDHAHRVVDVGGSHLVLDRDAPNGVDSV
jgi:hypothetical protein